MSAYGNGPVEQALQESEAKFRGIVEYANVGIAIVQDACFRFVNPHYAAMLGYTVEEMLGTEFMGYCTPEERDCIVDRYARRARGEPVSSRYETAILHKNGSRVYVDVSANMIPYDGRLATFLFLRDITEQKQARQALQEAYQTLEQRVGERTKDLAVLNSIAAVVSGSLDLKEIMSAALIKTLDAMDMEFGTAYCLECDREQAPEITASRLNTLTVIGPEVGQQVMLIPQGMPGQAPETDGLSLLAYQGVSASYAEFVGKMRLLGVAAALAHLGKPFVWLVEDTIPADSDLGQLLEREECRQVITMPLIAKGDLVGAINLGTRTPRAFSSEQLSLLAAVGQQIGMAVALAVESARLREQAGQAATMEERSRLARELHDSVTQSLYSVTMYAEAAARLLTSGQQAIAAEYLCDARDTAQEALREMRLLIYQLRPPILEAGGLAVALQVRLDAVERRGGIQAELHIEGQDRLPPAIQAELHQIAQEALNNALKHAHARRVQVGLCFREAATRLEIQDDGAGFELATVQVGGGQGLPGMKERAQKIGGRLKIESAPGQGTRVVVEVPIGGGG